MRLKSRTEFPPNGVQLLLPEVGMTRSLQGSFREMVAAYLQLAKRNPALFQKLGWPTDIRGAENFVEQRECLRLIAAGHSFFVDMQTAAPEEVRMANTAVKKNLLDRVVEVGKATKAGIGVWIEQFGPDGKPVAQELAEKRAAVCAGDGSHPPCPHNDLAVRLEDLFILPASNSIKFVYEMMRDLKLQVSRQDQLGVCRLCLCPLKSKVHTKLEIVMRHVTPDILQALPDFCWIKTQDK